MAPRVSVCIPSYNYAIYLSETLDSVLSQTYDDYEIIIVDDASTDGSLEILKDYASRHPDKVRVFTHPEQVNKGISATCNRAIEKASGEYLAWLGSDDVWYPEKLLHQVNELDRHKEIAMTYSFAEIIDSHGKKTGELIGRDVSKDVLPMLVAGNFIPHLTVTHRRSCLEKTGYYDETLEYSDWEMWLKLANFYKISFINLPLAKYRIHGANMFSGSTNEKQTQSNIEVIKKFIHVSLEGPLADPFIQGLLAIRMADLYFKLGQVEQSELLLRECWSKYPGFKKQYKYLANWITLFGDDPRFGVFSSDFFPCENRSKYAAIHFGKAAAFYRNRDLNIARKYAIKSIRKDFRYILRRDIDGIILQSSTSPKVYKLIRSLFGQRHSKSIMV